MLFNSYEFLFAFFPAVLLVFFILAGRGATRACLAWLVGASLVFYAWWDARFLALLLASIAGNYAFGLAIHGAVRARAESRASWLMGTGVALNLLVLGLFKYLGFFTANVDALFGTSLAIPALILPLGISFFTFEQISYLVDTRRGGEAERDLLAYTFFVAFFPRLVAGPILRASEILPQVHGASRPRDRWDDVAVGITLFAVGLFKKTFLADGLAPYASAVFARAAGGEELDLLTAWGGALAYTFQLYFDFSGYSDMAIGIARCFGIKFPVNFFSPYKALSIVDFWRRWHMTLSRFLRDYVYISLGGNRSGKARRYVNLTATMLLGGLWHGANWTFVAWGALHGIYLVINHAAQAAQARHPALARAMASSAGIFFCWLVTFIAVVVAWVFFRAPDFVSATSMLAAMVGANGIVIPSGLAFAFGPLQEPLMALGIRFGEGSGSQLIWTYVWVTASLAICALMPNMQEILVGYRPALDTPTPDRTLWLQWRPSRRWALATAASGLVAVLSVSRAGEFLYWQF